MIEYNKLSTKPLGVIIQLVGAKWKLLIVQELLQSSKRFSELKKSLKCTSKVLIKCLREMENDGLVIREEYDSISHKTEYFLTDIGYSLKPIIDSMQKWGKEYKRLRKIMEKYGEN